MTHVDVTRREIERGWLAPPCQPDPQDEPWVEDNEARERREDLEMAA